MAKSNIRVTKRAVGDLKATGKERFVWDNELIGFGARVSPKGLITYVYQYFLEGRTRRFKIGIHGAPWTPETARQEATRLAGLTVSGDDPQQAKIDQRNAVTVAQLCDLYLTEGLLTRKESSVKAARCDIEN